MVSAPDVSGELRGEAAYVPPNPYAAFLSLQSWRGEERSMDEERTMTTKTISPDDEVAILNIEISDELLESTAQSDEMCAFTLGSCTGLASCPA